MYLPTVNSSQYDVTESAYRTTQVDVYPPDIRNRFKPKQAETTPQDLNLTLNAAAVRSFRFRDGFDDFDDEEIALELASALPTNTLKTTRMPIVELV